MKPRLDKKILMALGARDFVSDFEIDQLLPPNLESISDTQWSSVRVARVVADLLADQPKAKFIDLGCGVGKFCLLLALMTDLKVFGVERRPNLLRVAKRLAEANAPGQITFIEGDLLSIDWRDFDVLYLFNPFLEHQCNRASASLIDPNIELSRAAFDRCIDETFGKLAGLRPGQSVITFHGYGGLMPPSLELAKSQRVDRGTVKLWRVKGEPSKAPEAR